MITIAIPVYNGVTTILASLESAANQNYEDKEILVIDQNSDDGTGIVVQKYQGKRRDVKIRYILSDQKGIGTNLAECFRRAHGKYVVYLCADDLFADEQVVADYVKTFETMKECDVLGHFFYQFIDGLPGPVMVSRDTNIITSSCNPSGIAFRKNKGDEYKACDKIFIEMPMMVAEAITKSRWTMIEYDTIAVRLHKENTAVREWYYNESGIQNWFDLTGSFTFYPIFIQIKNRAPKMLWSEICLVRKLNPKCHLSPYFWLCGLMALCLPRQILMPLGNFYRHRISRLFCKIKRREDA